jgi:phenylalanyl-tRNA synthetase beta chain
MFAEYCSVPFTIEPVKIHMADGSTHLSPPLAPRQTTASSSYINAATGLQLTREQQSSLLNRMSLSAQPSPSDEDILDVEVPCTRSDILHECDIMEDLAIAYGYNNLPQSMPTTNTVAKQWPVNKLADLLRKECAMAGWTEALPLILVSVPSPTQSLSPVCQAHCLTDDSFAHLNTPYPSST